MKVPQGFKFAGLHSGIKPNRKDLALIVSEAPCSAAGCFTQNLAKAAPVLDAEARLPASGVHAVVINSGNANALTGQEGLNDVKMIREALGAELRMPASSILTASTGVIGHKLPVHKILTTLPMAVASLKPEAEQAAEAILTTDTRIKMATRSLSLPGFDGAARDVTVSILAKGSGMIAPELATMIAVIVSDIAIAPTVLDRALETSMGKSFNALTIDGDMSTNDCVFALTNGLAGNAP
ncbi:MAG: bifunctional ornithine acetyltransferase/N-acetylglutamate synthase, partial [Deltaproteobacteria bacterium]|nr:bifunctional ornithine acetyltransferase/N-acetylglutamate synthase [Deltaproteobacteria bacterium]